LLIPGTLFAVAPYVAGFVAAATDTTYNRGWLFVPVIGHAVFASTTTTYIGFFEGILWAGTLGQAAGITMIVLGFVLAGRSVPVASNANLRVLPGVSPDSLGLTLTSSL
jgi:hypothetical protein